MTPFEHLPVSQPQILGDEGRIEAAMEALVQKDDPSFKIVMILIGLVMLYALGLPLNYA